MAFTLKMQAFLADRYYRHLQEKFPDQAMDALQVAFQRYVTLRGNRGAQRAVRDGKPLNFENYQRYREVVSTEAMRKIDGAGRGAHTLTEDEWVGCTYECPSGHGAFREMDSPAELELFFCKHIDRYNVIGFNPDIDYEAVSTLYDTDCCLHRAKNPKVSKDANLRLRAEDAPPYPFIVASEYFAMRQVITAIFGLDGETIADAVKEDFIQAYGQEDWDEIAQYQNANFDIYYPKCLG